MMNYPTAHVEVRSQHAKRGRSGFSGPDTYVAVQIVPPGIEPLKQLRPRLAELRGIKIVYCGEGYNRRSGPKSALGRAIAKAKQIAAEVNGIPASLESSAL